MPYKFTDPIDQNGGIIAYSPSSNMIGAAMGSRLTIREIPSLEVHHIYMAVDKIDKIEFSADSKYILCLILSRTSVQIFSLEDPEWKCRITEGVAGLIGARWCPDSRNVITESDFGIQLTVWSLMDSTSQVISYPKQTNTSGGNNIASGSNIAFSDCSRFVAVLHKIDLADHIAVYSMSPWSEISKFKCKESNNDVMSIQWTPNSAHIIAISSHLQYKVLIYSSSGELISAYEAYTQMLGIRNATIHRYPCNIQNGIANMVDIPPCPLIALGSYDSKVRLMSSSLWKVAFVLPCCHPKEMIGGIDNGVIPFVEVNSAENEDNHLIHYQSTSTYRATLGAAYVKRALRALPNVKPNENVSGRGNHATQAVRMGVCWNSFSGDGKFLAVRDESHPRCMWIWSTLQAKLYALTVQLDNITCARWRPFISSEPELESMLAFCCGSPRVYFFTPAGITWQDLPRHMDMKVMGLRWSHDGSELVLFSRDMYCTLNVPLIDETNSSNSSPSNKSMRSNSVKHPDHVFSKLT